jgi:hypothetical protein
MFSAFRTIAALVAILAGSLLPFSVQAADPVQIEPVERWSNVFHGPEAVFKFDVKAAEAFAGRANWVAYLEIEKKPVTIASGQARVEASPNKPGLLSIPLNVKGREGVYLAVHLEIRILGADGRNLGSLKKVLGFFPEDPFADRQEWLKSRKITLFDPAHTTAGVLKEAKIPFEEQDNQAVLADLREGILLIGEGASFKEEPQLANLLINLAARGVPVLCLAPAEGPLPLPGAGKAAENNPLSLSFRRQQVITSLDKRLDATAWAPDRGVVVSSLVTTASDGNAVAEVVRGDQGWAWMETEFAARKGRLIVCGFGMIKSWAKSPTPRYLFIALLERMTDKETREQDTPKGADK